MAKGRLLTYIISSISIALSVGLITIASLGAAGKIDILDQYYTVTFKNYDDTVLDSVTLKKGEEAVYENEIPYKPKTSQYSYIFAGWDHSLENVVSDFVAVAQFRKSINVYTAKFYNEASLIWETTLDYGSSFAYGGTIPSKEGNAQYSYYFVGWDINKDGTVDSLPSSLIYDFTAKALYLAELNTYTVTFTNYNGAILGTDVVKYDGTAVYSGQEPVRGNYRQYSYRFIGWDHALTNVASNFTTTAQYEEITNTYEATFYSGDDLLWRTVINYGEGLAYNGTPPTMTGNDQYSYHFIGWDIDSNGTADPLPAFVMGNVTAYAIFSSEVNRFTIKFENYDGTPLGTDVVYYDGTAVYSGPEPIRENYRQYSYRFIGWDQPLTNVTTNFTATAQYEEITNTYESTFYLESNLIWSTVMSYGESLVYGGVVPTMAGNDQYSYHFIGWDIDSNGTADSLPNFVTGDVTAYAIFSSEVNRYTVTFENYDGTPLGTDVVYYGGNAVYSGVEPVHENFRQYSYRFIGWDLSLNYITSSFTTIAQYEEITNDYEATFYSENTLVWNTVLDYGEALVYGGVIPTMAGNDQYSYHFIGWDVDSNGTADALPAFMTENVSARAIFASEVNRYTVIFKNYDGTLLGTDIVYFGDSALYSGLTPTKPKNGTTQYVFSDWMPSVNSIVSNLETVAQFTEIVPDGSGTGTGTSTGGSGSGTATAIGDFDGSIQTSSDGGGEPLDVFSFTSDYSGPVYFRSISRGDYTNNGFGNPVSYPKTLISDNSVNPLEYTSDKAKNAIGTSHFDITYLTNSITKYPVPSYEINNEQGLDSESYSLTSPIDGKYICDSSSFETNSINLDLLRASSFSNNQIQNDELRYRDFVQDTYLTVPAEHLAYFVNLADENNISLADSDVIFEVANYIQSTYTYDVHFPAIPVGEDAVLYFMQTSKRGICSHFAAAATLMYRSLGIPARYVCGYLGESESGSATVVTSSTAHAWTEIYLNGIGWITVDATGGTTGGFGGGGSGGDGSSDEYQFGFGTDGSSSGPGGSSGSGGTGGEADTRIKIEFTLADIIKNYDGKCISAADADILYDHSLIDEGDYIVFGFSLMKDFIDVGQYDMKFTAKVYDSSGGNVTSKYSITPSTDIGKLIISPREIAISTNSATKGFDNTALTCHEFTVAGDELAAGDTLSFVFIGSQTSIGSSPNTFDSYSVIILNSNGKDVTKNYIITYSYGTLYVTFPA